MIDIAIIGAGPAGLSAAIYSARANLDTVVFESLIPGGQLANIAELENYPGFAEPKPGYELSFALQGQAERLGARIDNAQITRIVPAESGTWFTLEGPAEPVAARSVIIATGARPRTLEGVGLEEYVGRGVSYCATCDGNFFRNQEVVVVGGGDVAAADAIYLSNICSKVHLVHRRDSLRANARSAKIVSELPNVEIHWNRVVDGVEGDGMRLSGIRVRDVETGAVETIAASGVFLGIGTVPETEWLEGLVERNQNGFIVAGQEGQTSVPGIFAAGDATTTPLRQVVTACADGALAAESAAAWIASC